MWKKKRITSVVLGVSVTITSVLPAMPAYAVDAGAAGKNLTGQSSHEKAGKVSTPSDAELEEDIWTDDEPLENDLEKATPSDAELEEELNLEEVPLATGSNAEENRHLAVYPGQVPEVDGVEWEDGVTGKDFKDPYDTVTISSAEGEEYKVEVVPDDLVYFIDSGAGESTPAFEAVRDLIPDLKNDAADQAYEDGKDWGYTGKDGDKPDTEISDKNDTGFYGFNPANSPVSYVLPLEAGTYKITSSHKDWWNMDRPMSISIKYGDTVLDAGTLNGNGVNEFVFTLESDQDVTYELNNTANQGSVVSWIAVEESEEEEWEGLALEDIGKVRARTGASLGADYEDGKMANVTEGWISGGDSASNGGVVLANPAQYLKRSTFTWYTDFLFQNNTKDVSANDNTSAFLLGNKETHIRLIPKKNDGTAVLRVKANGGETDYPLNMELDEDVWHSVAVLYHEEDSEGYVQLVVDGETALEEELALGFQLSSTASMEAGYGITYGTGYMRTGKYDNITVFKTLADTSDAQEETERRAEEKNALKVQGSRIVIDGEEIAKAAENMNGLTFKGFGVLDCNSTNALLLDYKAQHPEKYWEMLEVLFGGEHPIMQHIKIEMGNDKNTSTGSQSCTMRYEDEYPNVNRVTGFQLAADAKKINPNVKVSLLYWCAPGWVGSDWNNIYKWLKNTTIAAYREYGYMIDIISPGINEQKDDPKWIKQFNQWVENDTEGMISDDASVSGFRDGEEELFHEIQIIMSDEVGIASCGPQLTSDEELRDAVDIVGYHYNTDDDSAGSFKRLAEEFDKEIWNSEAQATFGSTADRPNNNMEGGGSGIGGNGSPLEMANTMIKGFANSRRTHFVYQPTFGAFYEGMQYNYKDVMAARDPWSGYVNYDGALSIMQHFSKFAVTGWEYDTPDENVVWRAIPGASKSEASGTNPVNGRNGGDNYMTLASPDGKDFSVIICNDSAKTKEFTISPKNLENLPADAKLTVWETRAAEDGKLYNENYVKPVETLTANEGGSYYVTVKPWSIVTVTTLDMADMEEELELPAASEKGRYVLDTDETGKTQNLEDTYLYADDFDYEDMGNVTTYEDGEIVESDKSFIESRGGEDGFYPLYTQDTNGTFEAVLDEEGNGVLQMAGQTGGGSWNGGEPATTIGDYRWTNYKASVDFDLTSTSEYLLLGVRQRGSAGGGDNKVSMSAYNVAVNQTGEWILRRYSSEIARGQVQIKDVSACNVAIQAAGDTITVFVDGQEVHNYKDQQPQLEGRIMLGVGLPGASWGQGRFDNLKVETVPGYIPYFDMVHDNLHMKQWDGEQAGGEALSYEGSWEHVNQKGSQYSQRSLSTSSQKGSSVSYSFEGTGFALIGENNGSAKVNVYVDGNAVSENAATVKTSSHQPYLMVRGLENGEHMVTVELEEGTLNVDSVAYMTAREQVSEAVDMTGLQAVLEKNQGLKQEDYDTDSWNAYQEALNSGSRWTTEIVQKLLADPVSYGADQETVQEITDYYEDLMNTLLRKDAPVEITSTAGIPKILAIPTGTDLSDGAGSKLPATVPVKNLDGTENPAAEITWKLSGAADTDYKSIAAVGTVTGGKNLTVTVPVEAVPENVVYFIDAGTEDQTIYSAYKEIFPELKNETNDKVYEEGSWGRNDTCAVKNGTDSMDKTDTGLYNDKEAIRYQLPLDAGIYTLTAGFTEWWGYGRDMSQTISYTLADGTEKTVQGDAVSFGERGRATGTVSFILPEDATVTYTVAKTKSQSPVISWLAVAAVGENEQAEWEPIFVSDESNQWNGLITKGTVVNQQDPEQGEVLHMNAAGTTYIQLDPNAVNLTGRENMTMSFDLKSETADGNFFTVAIGQDSNRYMFLRTREHDTYTAITKGSYGSEQKATAQVDTLNKWVHVDLAFSPEQLITYMDGVPVSTIDKDILVTDLGRNPVVYLGKSFYSNDKYFAGAFDNIEIYNRTRSAAELELSYMVTELEKLNRADYTAESWAVFEAALDAAKEILGTDSAEEAFEEAKTALTEAREALKAQTGKDRLAVQIEEAERLREEDYTAESWIVFEKALKEAKAVMADEAASNEAADKAAEVLKAAMEGLKKPEKPVEPENPDKPENPDEPENPVEPNKPGQSHDSDGGSSHSGTGSQTAVASGITQLNGSIPSVLRAGSWQKAADGSWRLIKADGSQAKQEWALLNGKWYLFDQNGKMVQGWAYVNQIWYYLDAVNGDAKLGWQLINGKWYYFDNATAAMTTGWQMIGGKWYYLDPANGHMLTGRISVNGVWYSMAADGSLNSNK